MIDRAVKRLYSRLGRRYKRMFMVAEQLSSLGTVVVAVLLISSYYNLDAPTIGLVLVVGCASTSFAVWWALRRAEPLLNQVTVWQEAADPTPEQTIAAWDAATNFPMRSFRANAVTVNSIAALPTVVAFVIAAGLPATAVLAVLAACVLPAAYGTLLNYAISETLMRPWIDEIAQSLPDDFPFVAGGLLIRKRLKLILPVFTGFVGLIVAAIMTGQKGTRGLVESVAAAAGVGLLLSTELTTLLSRSVTAPVAALRTGVGRVREGDYGVRVPVVTSDELGELSHDFNLMAAGLAERKRMREAFEAYHDASIVPFILSSTYPREGIAVSVSIMFVDVRGFTSFAERLEPSEVVAALNALFELMVPVVGTHGGHVDKFLGDGMLVVFGAPEGYADHADRAVAAGAEIVRAVNRPGSDLTVGVGVNSGTVIAGAIGGAGRLNFSVIGDAVNVAARVEAATRETGDSLLLTAATRDAMLTPVAVTSRGTVALKGKIDPVEVFAFTTEPLAADYGSHSSLRAPATSVRRS